MFTRNAIYFEEIHYSETALEFVAYNDSFSKIALVIIVILGLTIIISSVEHSIKFVFD